MPGRMLLAALLLLPLGLGACGPSDPLDAMAREHRGDRGDVPGAARLADGAVAGHEVSYGQLGESELRGYLAEAGPGAPALLVIHEWWGLNDNIRTWTRQLAADGYTALAVDLYEGRSASSPLEARMLAGRAGEQPQRLVDNLRQARAWLAKRGVPRVGVIGWCFGGGWSLRAALEMPDQIDAVVVYYGRLVTDRIGLGPLQAPLLGIFAGRDQGIPVAEVRRFQAALLDLGKPATIRIYEEADHAFANPSGTRYDEDAAKDAWRLTRAFLREHLRP